MRIKARDVPVSWEGKPSVVLARLKPEPPVEYNLLQLSEKCEPCSSLNRATKQAVAAYEGSAQAHPHGSAEGWATCPADCLGGSFQFCFPWSGSTTLDCWLTYPLQTDRPEAAKERD